MYRNIVSTLYLISPHKTIRIMSTFTEKVNPLRGISEWVLQNENYDYHQEVARASFADMLHDTERNVMYESGLRIAIETMHKRGKQAHVLDIGTGTGLLSMMAARHGADTITACEAFKPMSKCAGEVIDLNGYKDKITIVPLRSTSLKIGRDMPQKANILVTEVFDTELIGEGALDTFKHAHEYLLDSDCIVVPHKATIYAQIVESPLINNWNRLQDIYNSEGELLLQTPDNIKTCEGSSAVHDIQLNQIPYECVNNLVNPVAVFHFDFSGKTPIEFDRKTVTKVMVTRSGKAHAVFMWWDLIMDVNNKIVLSCAPYWSHPAKQSKSELPWRDHWMQAVYYLPKELHLEINDDVSLISSHDEFSLWFHLKSDNVTLDDCNTPRCTCNLHIACSRTRIGQLNDGVRNKKYLNILESQIREDSTVLVLGNGFSLGLVAAKLNAKRVIIVDKNTTSRNLINDMIAKNNLVGKQITVTQTIDDLADLGKEINVVISEPYFMTSILPWDNLLFAYSLNEFRPFFAENVKIFPRELVVMGVALEFKDLHKIRAPLKVCEGFKMDPFDQLIDSSSNISDETVEAQPLWEYPSKALSLPIEICRLDLTVNKLENVDVLRSFDLQRNVSCNAIVLWVDWCLDDSLKSAVTSGPIRPIAIGEQITWDMHSRQGVCLFGSKTHTDQISTQFKFNYKEANISFNVLE